MLFRFRYVTLGGHAHVKLFAGTGETLGKCGDLCFRNEEWDQFMELVTRGSAAAPAAAQFVDDSEVDDV